MIGYIIGLGLGVLVFFIQYLKPTSLWFRISFPILTIAFFGSISYMQAGFWNILIIPIGVLVLCFLTALCFPYCATDARREYMIINGKNYYAELQNGDKIGRINAPGLKQTYDRIIAGVLTQITSTPNDFKMFSNLLYSNNFYPLSNHTKDDVIQHIESVITIVSDLSNNDKTIQMKSEKNFDLLFNSFVSVMSIHEEATRRITNISEQEKMGNKFYFSHKKERIDSKRKIFQFLIGVKKNISSFFGTIAIIIMQSLVISAFCSIFQWFLSLIGVSSKPTWDDFLWGSVGFFIFLFISSVFMTCLTLYRYHKDPVFKDANLRLGLSWREYNKIINDKNNLTSKRGCFLFGMLVVLSFV